MATFTKSILLETKNEVAAKESVATVEENFLTSRSASAAGLILGEQIISVEIPFSAHQVWDVFANTHQLAQIFKTVPSSGFEDIQVVGDGGLGSLIIIFLRPGRTFSQYTETVVTLDHERRVKEVDVSEGGYLTVGYTFYRTRFEILSKDSNRATVRKSILYNVREDSAANLSLASANDNPDQVKAVENFLCRSGSSTGASDSGFITY